MATYTLSHITDLRNLSDEDVHRFAQELPTLVATLRQAAAAARAEGVGDIKDLYPSILYEPDMGDQVVFKGAGDKEVTIDGASMRVLDEAHQAITRARRRPA